MIFFGPNLNSFVYSRFCFSFFFLDRNNRREDLPAPDSQESLEQLCGGQGGRCGEALQPRATPRPL